MKKIHSVTAAHQLTRFFLLLFAVILIVINFLFVATASKLIYQYADDQAEAVAENVEKDWPTTQNKTGFLNAYVARQDDDAIEIIDGQQKVGSPKAPKIFKRIQKSRLAIKNLRITHHGIYYFQKEQFHHGRALKVAINVDDLIKLTGSLLLLTILINLVVIVVAVPVIRRLARRWTQPLTSLSAEVDAISADSSHLQTLAVPAEPVEVHKLGQSFNQLLRRQFAALQREKEFIANASHELKTPIAGILGHVNLIRRHGQRHPELVEKSLKYIDQEAQRLSRLVNELLILEGHQTPALTAINLNKVIDSEIASLQESYQRQFITTLQPDVSYPITPGDFQSLVHNLLENAAKYSPEDSPINVRLMTREHQLVLAVADQGRGIAKENRQKVFERFYREDESHSSTVPGSGIGLAIVKMIVDKYQGTITIRDNQPAGTIFTVELPLPK